LKRDSDVSGGAFGKLDTAGPSPPKSVRHSLLPGQDRVTGWRHVQQGNRPGWQLDECLFQGHDAHERIREYGGALLHYERDAPACVGHCPAE